MKHGCTPPSAYHFPVKLTGDGAGVAGQRAQKVPLDQSIWLASGVSFPVTEPQPGATIRVGPSPRPMEASPIPLLSRIKLPLSLIEARQARLPCPHHSPKKALDFA